MNHLTFDFDDFGSLARLMNRCVIQIRINDLRRISGAPGFARRRRRDQLAKQFTQDTAVMGQLIGYKQGLALNAGRQIFQHLPGIV